MPNDRTPKTSALIALMGWIALGSLTLLWTPQGAGPSIALALLRLAAVVQGLKALFAAAGLVPPSLAKE